MKIMHYEKKSDLIFYTFYLYVFFCIVKLFFLLAWQLMNVFRKNYDLLLSIFNPEGWLEITYPIKVFTYSFSIQI